MIPAAEHVPNASVPQGLTFWVPRWTAEDLDGDDGISGFIGTWIIPRMGRGEAVEALRLESQLLKLADELAEDGESFESLAIAFESGDASALPEDLRSGRAADLIAPHVEIAEPAFNGLELGVAGLVHALAAMPGCHPAASCRWHGVAHSWSPHPVVLLAADEHRTGVLADLVSRAGCGLALDPARPHLLAIDAASVRQLNALAHEVVSSTKLFRRPHTGPRAAPRPSRDGSSQQLSLGFDPR